MKATRTESRPWMIGVALGMLVLALTAGRTEAHVWSVPEIIEHQAAYYGVSEPQMARVIWCESTNNPRAVGKAGELGLVQLHPRGLLPRFYAEGYTDPFDEWESTDFYARMLRGDFPGVTASAWSCR